MGIVFSLYGTFFGLGFGIASSYKVEQFCTRKTRQTKNMGGSCSQNQTASQLTKNEEQQVEKNETPPPEEESTTVISINDDETFNDTKTQFLRAIRGESFEFPVDTTVEALFGRLLEVVVEKAEHSSSKWHIKLEDISTKGEYTPLTFIQVIDKWNNWPYNCSFLLKQDGTLFFDYLNTPYRNPVFGETLQQTRDALGERFDLVDRLGGRQIDYTGKIRSNALQVINTLISEFDKLTPLVHAVVSFTQHTKGPNAGLYIQRAYREICWDELYPGTSLVETERNTTTTSKVYELVLGFTIAEPREFPGTFMEIKERWEVLSEKIAQNAIRHEQNNRRVFQHITQMIVNQSQLQSSSFQNTSVVIEKDVFHSELFPSRTKSHKRQHKRMHFFVEYWNGWEHNTGIMADIIDNKKVVFHCPDPEEVEASSQAQEQSIKTDVGS